MPVTQESFRNDPRKRTVIRARSGFYLEGREDKPVVEDEVVEVPWSAYVTLLHSGKAEQYDGPVRVGDRVPNPDRERREAEAKMQKCPTCGQALQAAAKPAAAAAATKGADK